MSSLLSPWYTALCTRRIVPLFEFVSYVTLALHTVRPLTVRILSKQLPLVADRRYEVSCESAGSRPPAVITWYKGKRQLRRVKVRK